MGLTYSINPTLGNEINLAKVLTTSNKTWESILYELLNSPKTLEV
jgi:hypothetical protein